MMSDLDVVVETHRSENNLEVSIEDTPVGLKLGLVGKKWYVNLDNDVLNSFIDSYEDILVVLYEGDMEVVDDVPAEDWDDFVELVEVMDDFTVSDEELQAARSD